MLQLARGATRGEEARAGLLGNIGSGGSRIGIAQQQRGQYQQYNKPAASPAILQHNVGKQQQPNEANPRAGMFCGELDPPTGFTDSSELTDAEASRAAAIFGNGRAASSMAMNQQRNRHQQRQLRDFVIAV